MDIDDKSAVPAAAVADANNELDALAGGASETPNPAPNPDPAPNPAPAPEKKDTPTPQDQPKDQPKDQLDLNAGLPKKKEPAAQKPPQDEFAGAKVPAQLRKAYEETKQKLSAAEAELAKLRGAPQAPKLDDIPEYKTAKQEAEELRKKYEEAETNLRFVDYTKSSEFQEQYKKPLDQAFDRAVKDVTAMQIEGEERTATLADFNALLRMDTRAAAAKAAELFGPAAPEVLAHRRQILGLVEKQQNAIAEYKTKGAERAQQQAKEFEESTKRLNGIFDEHLTSRQTGDPEIYKAADGDAEAAEILKTGTQLVNLAFRPSTEIPPDSLAKIQAEVASRAIGYGRALQLLGKTREELEQVKARLAEFEESDPPNTGEPGRQAKAAESYEDEIDRMAGLRK